MTKEEAIKMSKKGFIISASEYSDGSYRIEQEQNESIEKFIERAEKSFDDYPLEYYAR